MPEINQKWNLADIPVGHYFSFVEMPTRIRRHYRQFLLPQIWRRSSDRTIEQFGNDDASKARISFVGQKVEVIYLGTFDDILKHFPRKLYPLFYE